MLILALDAATVTGYAFGPAGAKPKAGVIRLARPGAPESMALIAFYRHLGATFEANGGNLGLLAYEHPLNPKYARGTRAAVLAWQLYGLAAVLAHKHGARLVAPRPAEVRKWLCGRASAFPRQRGRRRSAAEAAEARKAVKRMVIDRLHMLGYLDEDCFNSDIADAVALHMFAAAKWSPER